MGVHQKPVLRPERHGGAARPVRAHNRHGLARHEQRGGRADGSGRAPGPHAARQGPLGLPRGHLLRLGRHLRHPRRLGGQRPGLGHLRDGPLPGRRPRHPGHRPPAPRPRHARARAVHLRLPPGREQGLRLQVQQGLRCPDLPARAHVGHRGPGTPGLPVGLPPRRPALLPGPGGAAPEHLVLGHARGRLPGVHQGHPRTVQA
mmetsp:Transcript_31150/g.45644  ORF Transcript_31150/g.45644 Transcript_31150/m.45644 type:complete len:203 (+) Transcript_31150:701-1309(+)